MTRVQKWNLKIVIYINKFLVDVERSFVYNKIMKYKNDNKLNNIFKATLELINEDGLSGTSMSKIAKRANISASTIYVYFDSKEDLIFKLYLLVKNKLNFEIYNNIDKTVPFETLYKLVLRKFIYFIYNNKDYFLFMEQFQNSPIKQNIDKKEEEKIFMPTNELYDVGKSQNAIKNIDNILLTIYTFYPAMEFVKNSFEKCIELNEENINLLIQLSWDAIKK